MYTVNKLGYGEKQYTVYVGNGTAWLEQFLVFAYNSQEAVDLVADYIESKEMVGLYGDHYEIADCCDAGQTVDEYAEANNLVCCGNHGIYINVIYVAGGI